jgi:hypothetical protein
VAKQGMKRPEIDANKPPKNEVKPVPEIQGKAKKTDQKMKGKEK